MHIITSMGDTITTNEVDIYISNFLSYGLVNKTEAKLLKVATSDNVLIVPQEYKDILRASIFKNMILNLVEWLGTVPMRQNVAKGTHLKTNFIRRWYLCYVKTVIKMRLM